MPDNEAKPFYTIDDLRNWESSSAGLDPDARLAVIGDPVAHSRSPQMHNPALDAGNKNCQYIRLQLSPEDLRDGLELLKERNFIGTNVTIPHKGDVYRSVNDMTEVAKLTHSVNTVLMDGDQLIGHNTDAPGLEKAVREEFAVDLSDLRVLVLGAGGGAGRAASVISAINRSERLVLVNRTFDKAQSLKTELEPMYARSERLLGPVDRLVAIPHQNEYLARELEHTDLIINATSIGMKVSDPALIPHHLLMPHHLVYDMVYAPPKTRLMREAEQAGARVANGLSMLLWQGALAYEFWFNEAPPVEVMRKGLLDSLKSS